MKLSKISESVEQSFTRQLFNKAAEYDDVIDFTLGDPDYITPECIRKAGCESINTGKTKYSANAGLKKLRDAISGSIFSESGVKYDPENEIIVTVGAMQALYLSILCMIDEGDEVIIPAPYWINYKHMTEMCHGRPVIVSAREENQFIVTPDEIREAITLHTKVLIINSPNNPTGIIYDHKTVESICKLARENDITIIWDESYKSIVYDDIPTPSVLDFPDMKGNAVIINSFSKKFSMTGWRIGYAAAPKELIAAMTRLQENMVACAPLPSQYAAIAALEGADAESKRMRDGFRKRRDILVDGINKTGKLGCNKPQGTFYAFVNIKKTGLSDVDFAYSLLDRKHVAVVPGITYGDCCGGYIRLAYTMDEDKLREGIKRIKEFTEEL